ncbi:hypothetical protein LTS18_006247 [Coniosporium uncinatum]|uniref:Uncharacterized protein n=1 Tax=Coniosporium uncinatum TaxID=93489 RepID=A0ACC3DQH8_9PEZI|nr:hypothetical protein LTS18_006247 [Coniosporium uncinatum]
MAGTTLVLEIGFVDNAPTRVKLDVQSSTEADQKHFAIKAQEQSASNLLRNNLTPTSGQSRIALTLDKFAANLERLARLDKLEGASFNCFEALAGVYASLKRLYDHEMKAAMTLFKSEGKAAMEVMCKKSGKPRWNAGNTVGLGIDYWTGRRFSPRQTVKTEMKGDAMDVDSATQPGEGGPQETYFLSIECESHPAQLYQSARITNDWLSEQIEKVPPDDPTGVLTELLESLDWLEPPPTYLKPSEDDNRQDAMAVDVMPKLPNVRFVAKMKPPIVLPQHLAMQVLGMFDHTPAETIKEQKFEDLVLYGKNAALTPRYTLASPALQALQGERMVSTPGGDRKHENSLRVPRPDYGVLLEELPFEHPKQLISLLPMLRQYAYINSLIRDTFQAPLKAPTNGISAHPAHDKGCPLHVDVTLLSIDPPPKLTVSFPRAVDNARKDSAQEFSLDELLSLENEEQTSGVQDSRIQIAVEILQNAEIQVMDQNVYLLAPSATHQMAALKVGDGEDAMDVEGGSEKKAEGEGEGAQMRETERLQKVRRLGRALDVSGDLGVWVEWVRKIAERESG